MPEFEEGYRKEFHRGDVEGRILGGHRFAEKALAKAEQVFSRPLSIGRIMEAVCSQYQLSDSELAQAGRARRPAEARAMLALLVREADYLTLVELGRRLGRNVSGLSQSAGRLQKRLSADKGLATRLKKIKERLPPSDNQVGTA